MPFYRLTFFYEQGRNGWSESVHSGLTDNEALKSQASKYMEARLSCLHRECTLTHIRISDDEVYRDVILDPLQLPRVGSSKLQTPPDSPFTAVLLRMGTLNPTVQRSLFMRGIPGGQTDGVLPNFTANMLLAIQKFVAVLTDKTFSIKFKDRTQDKFPILSVAPDGTTVMTSAIPGMTIKSKLQLLGVPRSKVPGRLFALNSYTTGTNFQVRGWPDVALAGEGFFRLSQYQSLAIQEVDYDAITERRIGRPFGQLRGRRAKVR